MPVWKMQCSWAKDTTEPKDRFVITPHFNDAGALTDPQSLAEDLLAGLQVIHASTGEVSVKAYDAQGTVPVFPQGEAVANPGATQPTSLPRELAVCLSFYSERPLPRQRGRLYLPCFLLGMNSASMTVRPSTGLGAFTQLVTLFTGLGGSDVDWSVYSKVDDTARPVTDWWVDNEWDVQRRRGLEPNDRTEGTTTEA